MPKSRVRKKKVYTPPSDVRPASGVRKKKPSPPWVPVLAVAMIMIGIAYLVTYYLTEGKFPIEKIEYWNLAVGFSFLVGSLGVLTQWR